MKNMPLGAQGTARVVVTSETLASRTGSGGVDVFSTPNLVLLMEEAAVEAVRDFLDPGETSVGALVNIRHLAPTPAGMTITATARLSHVDGRRLVFQVEAHDGVDRVGEGVHERFIISTDRFISRAREKSTRRNTSSVE